MTKSLSDPDHIANEDIEAHILECALKFDQSDDPIDHVKARAIRAFGVAAISFLANEVNAHRKGVQTSHIVMGFADVIGSLMASVNSTALSDGHGERAPAHVEIRGMASMTLMALESGPHRPLDVMEQMARILRDGAAMERASA